MNLFFAFVGKFVFENVVGNDQNCVRFLNFEGNFNEIPLECVCLLNLEQIEIEPTIEKKKKNNKINFDHFFYEKYLMMPTISENMKILILLGTETQKEIVEMEVKLNEEEEEEEQKEKEDEK